MWSCPLTNHMHIFIAFAILNEHRQNIFQKCEAFDETLKVIKNKKSGERFLVILTKLFFHLVH